MDSLSLEIHATVISIEGCNYDTLQVGPFLTVHMPCNKR